MNFKYDEVIEINGQKLNKKYIASLDRQQREALIDPIFNLLRQNSYPYPDDKAKIKKEWQRILNFKPDLTKDEIYNNSSLGTYICRYFCHTFFEATEVGKPTMIEVYNDDDKLKDIIYNRLGLKWYTEANLKDENKECFNLTPKAFAFTGIRSSRAIAMISLFKPDVAKFLTMKYSNEGDTVLDYSAGFGARMMGAASCNRKYIGIDPLTIPDLEEMKKYLDLKDVTLINGCSEDIKLNENSVDFSFSSISYFNQEYYSSSSLQCYNKGENYYYNTYWKQTLENVKFMLKPDKYFGLNITYKYPKVIEMAKEQFGEPVEIIKLRLTRSHLNKTDKSNATKFEPVFVFKNIK